MQTASEGVIPCIPPPWFAPAGMLARPLFAVEATAVVDRSRRKAGCQQEPLEIDMTYVDGTLDDTAFVLQSNRAF